MGTGGGRSEWCNRLLEVVETDGAGFLLAGEARERKLGLVEHRGDVVRWGIRRRMRRAIALIFLCATLLTLGAGAVWAATLMACPNVLGTDQCMGTSSGDVMTATDEDDSIAGLKGRDRINDAAEQDIDTINGGPDDDTIDVREGNTGLNNRDLVDCGKGERDRVFFDEGEEGDKVVRCEIKNPR